MPKKPLKDPRIEGLIKELEQRGYAVKPKREYQKKTFDITTEQLTEINRLRVSLDMTLRDVFEEALDLWITEKRKP